MQYQLKVPCAYQGGKQRIAKQIVDIIFQTVNVDNETHFYDLCSGSGAVTIELINRGVHPSNIFMLDISSWGAFWYSVGSNQFNYKAFKSIVESIPTDKKQIKNYITNLAREQVNDLNEPYLYPILQACSFGGKQIWRDGSKWRNAFFRDYWEPKKDSVRRSPANPMQPQPKELLRRIDLISNNCRGVNVIHDDVHAIFSQIIKRGSVIYLDPPYRDTTGYAFEFDVDSFIKDIQHAVDCDLFVSEGYPITNHSVNLKFGGPNGGITGSRGKKHEEWLSHFSHL